MGESRLYLWCLPARRASPAGGLWDAQSPRAAEATRPGSETSRPSGNTAATAAGNPAPGTDCSRRPRYLGSGQATGHWSGQLEIPLRGHTIGHARGTWGQVRGHRSGQLKVPIRGQAVVDILGTWGQVTCPRSGQLKVPIR